jgi:hypothetical protein
MNAQTRWPLLRTISSTTDDPISLTKRELQECCVDDGLDREGVALAICCLVGESSDGPAFQVLGKGHGQNFGGGINPDDRDIRSCILLECGRDCSGGHPDTTLQIEDS